MLVDSDGDVLLLPATTRYESPGGGTETSTERRIIFSPEIPGRRIGSAQPEWWVFREVDGARVPGARAPGRLRRTPRAIRARSRARCRSTPASRRSRAKGDQVQWGGRTLYADGRFATPDGKAHFAVGRAARATRAHRPTLLRLDAPRQAVQLDGAARRRSADRRRPRRHPDQRRRPARGCGCATARRCGFAPATASSAAGCKRRRSSPATSKCTGPKATCCCRRAAIDPDSLEPDYNAVVTIEAAGG